MHDVHSGSAPAARRKSFAALLNVLSILLLLGALWRWREMDTGEIVWLAGFMVMLAIRMPFSRQSMKQRTLHSFTNAGEISLLGVLATTMVLPLIYLATGFPAALDYELPRGPVIFGVLLLVASLWLFWRSHSDLARYWSPGLEIQENHRLVTDGVYRFIRHPMYTAVLGLAVAQPLLVHNYLAGPPVVPAIVLFLMLRIPVEEKMMNAHFGPTYHAYVLRTGSLFPKIFSDAR